MDSTSTTSMLLATITLFLIGAVFLLWAYADLAQSSRQKNWLPIDAKVVRSEIVKGRLKDRGTEARSSGFMWSWMLEYEYVVNGEIFQGSRYTNKRDRLTAYNRTGDPSIPVDEELANAEREFTMGKTIKVFYSPKRPEKSYMLFESRLTGFLVPLGVGILCMLAGANFLRMMYF